MEVMAPAVGLLLTGILAFLGSLVTGVVLAVMSFRTGESAFYWASLVTLPIMAAGLVLIIGAMNMMRLKSYSLAVTAAILALIPWSIVWILGLPFGILALVVLRRRNVMGAFLDGSSSEASKGPEPKAPRAGKFVSFFRSVRGYFLPTSAGYQSLPQSRTADGSKERLEELDQMRRERRSLPLH